MEEKMTSKKQQKGTRHPGLIIASVVMVLLGMLSCFYGFKTTKTIHLSYSDNASQVNYQVCNFDSESPLVDKCEKNDVYIASLIEFISADYNYIAEFSEPISGDLSYQLVATVVATKNNSKLEYGKREYPLTEVKTKALARTNTLSISEMTTIDYAYYNDIIKTLPAEVAASGMLDLELRIDGTITTENLGKNVNFDTSMHLEIPLAEQDVEIAVKVKSDEDAKKDHQTTANIDNNAKLFARCFSLFAFASGLVFAVFAYRSYHASNTAHRYERNVNKIRSAYDSIIIDLRTPLDTRELDVHEVMEFDELIDAYNAVHQPINFYQTDAASYFVVVNEKIAWCYILRKADYKIKRKKSRK